MKITLILLGKIMLLGPFIVLMLLMLPLAWWLHDKHPERLERILWRLAVWTSLISVVTSIGMLSFSENLARFSCLGIDFRLDALSIFTILLINLVAFAASLNARDYLTQATMKGRHWWQQKWAFHIWIHLFHFTMLLVPLSDNLVIAWIAIELTTLGSAILILYEDKPSALEATWKYLVITSAGIVLALLGTIFLANSIPPDIIRSNELLDWTFLISQHDSLDKQFVWLAFLFALAGYGTKAGLAPLHTWLPDGHGEAPSPVSALLSGVLLKASLYVILRFFALTNAVVGEAFQQWTFLTLLVVGLVSLVAATPLILRQKTPFKRVLAYHSLEHMGIIVFGLGMGGFVAVAGAILHMLNHAITKALMFLAYGNLLRHYRSEGVPIRGALRVMPWSGTLLTLGGLALVGTPPFNVFMSEWMILWGALGRFSPTQGKYPPYPVAFAIVAIGLFVLSTTLIFYGLVGHLRKIVLGKPGKVIAHERFSLSAVGPLLFLFVLMLCLGVWILPPIARIVRESTEIVLSSR